ncbi:hypothetical protein ACFZDG_01490 [Kitasatospora xanthocidica]|uniref:hypothetical protein n=1 Tax=Kitasatospora xanthocidica TaxID=83382 RepID=UPI0036EA2ED8
MSKRVSGSAATRCFYCGAGLKKALTRNIVVNGRTVRVHRWHPRSAGEVSA